MFCIHFILNVKRRQYLKYRMVARDIAQQYYRMSQNKGPTFEKMLLPEHHSNDIENCLFLSLICPIRFSNLPGFNQPFLAVEMGDLPLKGPHLKPAKPSNNNT